MGTSPKDINVKTGAPTVAKCVSEQRLWQWHLDMAAIGATPKGGVNRQAFTPEDIAARRVLVEWAERRRFPVAIDGIGNMFIQRPGSDHTARPVMTGSHIDTQPTGGRFDGIYGILAGVEVLEAFEAAGVKTCLPVEVAIWTNEEGSRFAPGCMGSKVYAEPKLLPAMLAVTDLAGVSVANALDEMKRAFTQLRQRDLRSLPAAFIEAHIEQGPRLEQTGRTIGIVTGIQGTRWFKVNIEGEEGHAGTMPRARRKDALSCAVRMIHALEQLMADSKDTVRFTVGRIVVSPNAPSVIPGNAMFTIDFRHPDSDTLVSLGDQIEPLCQAHAGSCSVTVTEIAQSPPITFAGVAVDAIRTATKRLGLTSMLLPSGAVHDSENLHKLCPTGMIFVPCKKGISHNEIESATPSDLAAGTRVLAEAILTIAGRIDNV